MAHSIYAVREGERCPRCGYRRNEYPHFRTCVPRQKWPQSMADPERKKRVVVGGLVMDADDPRAQAVSGEASPPASVALPDVADAGASQSPEAAQTLNISDVHVTRIDMTTEPWTVEHYDPNPRCECGYTVPESSKNPTAAMRMHLLKSKAHKGATE